MKDLPTCVAIRQILAVFSRAISPNKLFSRGVNHMGSNHSIFPSYKSTVFANPAITVDEISIWKDKVQRLLVFETMANTLKPAKKHYDQVCESVNSYHLPGERCPHDCIRRFQITNRNRQYFFKWGLKEIGLMEEFKPMTGPNNPYHDTNSGKDQDTLWER